MSSMGHRGVAVLIWGVVILSLASVAQPCRGQACGEWQPLDIPDLTPGVRGEVHALVVHDDGTGPALYVGGEIMVVDSAGQLVRGLARLRNGQWSRVWDRTDDVYALTTFDNGSGSALYAAASEFSSVIYRIQGQTATNLGGVEGSVRALQWYAPPGGSPSLFAGGWFYLNNQSSCSIVRFDGSTWQLMEGGVYYPPSQTGGPPGPGTVYSLSVFDAGSGPSLLVAGSFLKAGNITANGLALWRGGWLPFPGWTNPNGSGIYAATPSPGGSELYIGGYFQLPGVSSPNVARWSSATGWTGVGAWSGGPITAMGWHTEQGQTPVLHVAGGQVFVPDANDAYRPVGRFANGAWEVVGLLSGGAGSIVSSNVVTSNVMADYNDGAGPSLYVGGQFNFADSVMSGGLARMAAGGIQTVAAGRRAEIITLAAAGEGPNRALYAGGLFSTLNGVPVNGVARWTGSSWAPLGAGVRGVVRSIASGPTPTSIVVGGVFDRAGAVDTANVALWDGQAWQSMGSGLPLPGSTTYTKQVNAVVRGITPAFSVMAAGAFGGGGANGFAGWSSGGNWAPVAGAPSFRISAAASNADSPLAGVYVCGPFSSFGTFQVRGIARWNGSQLVSVGSGFSSAFNAPESLLIHDVGDGPRLYGGGTTHSSGLGASGWVIWNGSQWSSPPAMAAGGRIAALAGGDVAFDRAVYAAGNFSSVNGVPANNVARWDGQQWSALGSGLQLELPTLVSGVQVSAAYFDDGSGPALYVGGDIVAAGGLPTRRLARYRVCSPCYANCDGSTTSPVLNVNDFVCFNNRFAAGCR
jgi:hypothetical protein